MSNLGNKSIMARNIQHYMEMYNKTRNDMCEALGVKYTTLADWIKGNTYPRIDKIELMANYFGIQKSDLIEDKSDQDTFPPLTAAEESHMRKYRKLSDTNKVRIDERIDILLEEEREDLKRVSVS